MGSVTCPSILRPPEDTILQVRLLEDEDEARKIARELHNATHLGGHALWKLFRDRYTHKASRRICLETVQSCPQCQLGTDYGHRQKTTGTIQSQGPWDTLSINIVGPLPPDHHHEFLIVFLDCYSKYTILIPSSNHTANTVSEALLRHVIPYFGTPRRLLSDRGREFISAIWTKLLRSLGIQQRLQLTHQQMAAPPTAPTTNPYQIGSLIFPLTTPPERTSKLAPRWKGPYRVCRIPNEYQVVYKDGEVERTIHVNHAKSAKFTAPDLPEPVPPVEEPCPPLGYLPVGFTHKPSKPRAPPVNRNEAAMASPGHSSSSSRTTSRRRASQSKSRTRSTSPALSQAQS